jgi:hypothetical protein
MKELILFAVILLLPLSSCVAQDEPFAIGPLEHWQSPSPTPAPTPTPIDCDHTSNSADRFKAIALLPPLKIRNFDLRNIEYTFEDKAGLHVGSVTADEQTVMPANIWKEYKSKFWWVLYCEKDGHAYTIVEVTPEQMQEYKAPKRVPKKL